MKQISETIDGSMKDILQLKTLDNSLEYSQMYDALEDTPRDFQTKLIDALNSLSQTMGCSPEEAFNKVLCKSDDGNEDVTKKLYNWWRAFFEVLGKCEKVPTVRVSEFNKKIDDLMAEIMKAGDAESTDGEEPVMESDNGDIGYQQATKDDEDKMLADMDFAVQHIGEIANKVKAVVNFINPYCESEFNEEKNTMKFNKIDERAGGGDSDEWVSIDDYVGEEFGESDGNLDDDQFKDNLMSMKPVKGDVFENYDVSNLDDGVVELNVLVNKPRVSYSEVEQRYAPIAKNAGWKFDSFAYADKDDTVVAGNDDMCAINVKFSRAANQLNEETTEMKNELKKGDDGWTEIGQPVGEAKVTVDVNDVWEVLDLLDNEIAHTELTDLINSHLRTEEEIMDAINELSGETITKRELNTLLSGKMSTLVDYLGLDVERYESNGDFVDSDKPTSVELEGTDWKDITEKLTAEELADSISGWEDRSKKLVVRDAHASGSDIVNVDVLTVTDKRDEVMKMANDYLLGNVENWQVADASEPRKDENGQFYTELILEPKYEEVSENNDEVKSGDVKDGEKQVTQNGDTKTLVTGSDDNNNRQKVNEMTIEQEIDNPWKLLDLLWGQGKENLEDLLRADVVDEEYLMQMLEDMEIHNLTSINDAFAFDFPTILDMLGLDGKAWSRNLEIKRKDEYDSDED